MNRKTIGITAILLALAASSASAAGDFFDWNRGTGGVPPPVESIAPDLYAQNSTSSNSMDAVRAMDTDKDGMISKPEFMRMMEAKFDAMDRNKTGKLTPAQVQQSITEIGKTYGYNN